MIFIWNNSGSRSGCAGERRVRFLSGTREAKWISLREFSAVVTESKVAYPPDEQVIRGCFLRGRHSYKWTKLVQTYLGSRPLWFSSARDWLRVVACPCVLNTAERWPCSRIILQADQFFETSFVLFARRLYTVFRKFTDSLESNKKY